MKIETENQQIGASESRRNFLKIAGGVAAAPFVAAPLAIPQESHATVPAQPLRASTKRPLNVLFVFSDQERYMKETPKNFLLAGHERMRRKGVTFRNHYCPAVMCTSSRAVLLTGLQTADNRMFENADMPYVKALSTQIPTIGHMLRKAGYYTAYKGKWHLNKDFDTEEPTRLFSKEMDAYGFSDFTWPGDVLVHTLGGYKHDHMIAGSAIFWLREKGSSLSDEGKPWSLFVSLVNPHDIMYFNTDKPGQHVQDTGKLMMHAARAPDHPMYRREWHAPLPKNLTQRLDEPGRPAAHAEFSRAWGYTLGNIPLEAERWNRFTDFYLNSLLSVDSQLAKILDELEALGLSQNTIVVYTSDHGEMGGAHGLRGKGPFAYEEAIHLPLLVTHPDIKGGYDSHALTSHIDLVPSILSMCGINKGRATELAGRDLPGMDISPALHRLGTKDVHAVRKSILFTYSGIATNDSELTRIVADARAAGQEPKAAVRAAGYKPNMKKRGSVRTVFDGRYKFSRYFAPVERNQPRSVDELYSHNDVELFDLKNDPDEMLNLGSNADKHGELIKVMSDKLESIIKNEIGVDDGREMPPLEGVDWSIDRIDL